MYFAMFDNNQVTGIVRVFSGYKFVEYVFGAGQSKFSIIKDKISLFETLVYSKYIVFWTISLFLKPKLIPNCSTTRFQIVLAIYTEFVQHLLANIYTDVRITDFALLASFFDLLTRDFFGTRFAVLNSTIIKVDN